MGGMAQQMLVSPNAHVRLTGDRLQNSLRRDLHTLHDVSTARPQEDHLRQRAAHLRSLHANRP